MTLTRYSHWQNADEMKRAFDRLFNGEETDQSNVVTSQWLPRVDIKEEKDRFVIEADIPGVDPNEIDISMEKGVLTIKGERKGDEADGAGTYTRVERARGTFYRRFALPDSANPDGISASGKHGVLEIAIPKRPEQTPRRIKINAGTSN